MKFKLFLFMAFMLGTSLSSWAQQPSLLEQTIPLMELRQFAPRKALRAAYTLQQKYPQEPALTALVQDFSRGVEHLPHWYLEQPTQGVLALHFHQANRLLYALGSDGLLRAWEAQSKQLRYESAQSLELPASMPALQQSIRLEGQGQWLLLYIQRDEQIYFWNLDLKTRYELPKIEYLAPVGAFEEEFNILTGQVTFNPLSGEKLKQHFRPQNFYPDPKNQEQIWVVYKDSIRLWSLRERAWKGGQLNTLERPDVRYLSILGPQLSVYGKLPDAIKKQPAQIHWQNAKGQWKIPFEDYHEAILCNYSNLYIYQTNPFADKVYIHHYREDKLQRKYELPCQSKWQGQYAFPAQTKQNNWAYVLDQYRLFWVMDDSSSLSLPHDAPIQALSFSTQGDSLWVGDADGMIYLWLKSSLKSPSLPMAHAPNKASLSPDGRYLVLLDDEAQQLIWYSIESLKEVQRLALPKGHSLRRFLLLDDGLNALIISLHLDQKILQVGHYRQKKAQWSVDLNAGEEEYPTICLGLNKIKNTLLVSLNENLYYFDFTSGKLLRQFKEQGLRFTESGMQSDILFDAKGERFALSSQLSNGDITVMSTELRRFDDASLLCRIPSMMISYPIAFYPEGLMVGEMSPVSVSPTLYDDKGKHLYEFPDGQAFALSPDGRHLVCSNMDNEVMFYDVAARQLLWKTSNYQYPFFVKRRPGLSDFMPSVYGFEFTDSLGQYFLLWSDIGVQLWNSSGQPVLYYPQAQNLQVFALSPDRHWAYAHRYQAMGSEAVLVKLPLSKQYWASLPTWDLPNLHRAGVHISLEEWKSKLRQDPSRSQVYNTYLRQYGFYQLANAIQNLPTFGRVIEPQLGEVWGNVETTDRYIISPSTRLATNLPVYPLGQEIQDSNSINTYWALNLWDWKQQRSFRIGNFKDYIGEWKLSSTGQHIIVSTNASPAQHFLFEILTDTARYIGMVDSEQALGYLSSFSPSGKLLIGKTEEQINFWYSQDFQSHSQWKILKGPQGDAPVQLCISPDDQLIAFAYNQSHQILVQDLKTGKVLYQLKIKDCDYDQSMRFNAQGDLWYFDKGSQECVLTQLKGDKAKELKRIPAKEVIYVNQACLNLLPIGSKLQIQRYNEQTGVLEKTLELPKQNLIFSMDGRYIFGQYGEVWSWAEGKIIGALPLKDGENFSPYLHRVLSSPILHYWVMQEYRFIALD
jgi:WD40 repeat protein